MKKYTICIIIFFILLFFIPQKSHPKIPLEKNNLESYLKSKKSALIICYICFLYETDNGRFPRGIDELLFPFDYFDYFSKEYNTTINEIMVDTLSNTDGYFHIIPLIKCSEEDGYNLRKSDLAIISATFFNKGHYDILNYKVLERGKNYKNFSPNKDSELNEIDFFYIKQSDFHSLLKDGFKIDEIIKK